MFEPGLVSVISPCYNVEAYIPILLESLLAQTYRKLEIILVNDGSTDNTGDVITAWLHKLDTAGFLVKYIVKENGGQSSAINDALPHFTGEFLTWPDPDDFLYPTSIEKRVQFLTNNLEFGIVRSAANIYHEDDNTKVVGALKSNIINEYDKNFFEDIVFTKTYFAPICYMVRSSYFLITNPTRSIYVSKAAGQNWQMLLPLAAKYKCGYLDISLCGYLIHKNSHSHSNNTFLSNVDYLNMCLDVLKNTLKSMGLDGSGIYCKLDIKYSIKRYHLGLKYSKCKFVENELNYLNEVTCLTLKQKVIMYLCKNSFVFKITILPVHFIVRVAKRIINTLP